MCLQVSVSTESPYRELSPWTVFFNQQVSCWLPVIQSFWGPGFSHFWDLALKFTPSLDSGAECCKSCMWCSLVTCMYSLDLETINVTNIELFCWFLNFIVVSCVLICTLKFFYPARLILIFKILVMGIYINLF